MGWQKPSEKGVVLKIRQVGPLTWVWKKKEKYPWRSGEDRLWEENKVGGGGGRKNLLSLPPNQYTAH